MEGLDPFVGFVGFTCRNCGSSGYQEEKELTMAGDNVASHADVLRRFVTRSYPTTGQERVA